MRFGRRTGQDRTLHVDITPMIDVVFLLIIFFLTTAQFASMTRADVELPTERGEQEDVSEEAGLVINITAEGEIIIDQDTLTLDDLEQAVESRIQRADDVSARNFKLLLRADRNASAAQLNQVVSLLQRLGVGSARVGTEVPR